MIAVELDPALAGTLRRRFSASQHVIVVEADLRLMPLPKRPFAIVANPPFALTTLLCRRLLGDPAIRLTGAELLLEWGAAKWLTSREPRDPELRRWRARYDIRLVLRVPAGQLFPQTGERRRLRPYQAAPARTRSASLEPDRRQRRRERRAPGIG